MITYLRFYSYQHQFQIFHCWGWTSRKSFVRDTRKLRQPSLIVPSSAWETMKNHLMRGFFSLKWAVDSANQFHAYFLYVYLVKLIYLMYLMDLNRLIYWNLYVIQFPWCVQMFHSISFIYRSTDLSTYQFIELPIYQSTYLPPNMFSLSIYCIYLSVCLSVCLSNPIQTKSIESNVI